MLQLPAGSATLLVKDARAQRFLTRRLETLCESWAYLPVHPGLVDYASAYEGLVSDKDLGRVYRLLDREGEVLMLRWDITIFLIKQIRTLVQETALPLRLYYADSILRHQDSDDVSRNEFFQTGAELFGVGGPEGELEVLLLFAEAFSSLGVHAKIHVGNRALFDRAFASSDAVETELLTGAVENRDRASLRSLVEKVAQRESWTGDQRDAVVELFLLLCPAAEAGARIASVAKRLPGEIRQPCEALAELLTQAMSCAPALDLHADCSELGTQGYHSGTVFQAYVEGIPSAVGAGGRYDRLLERMGCPVPALGWSLMLSRLIPLCGHLVDGDEIVRLSPPGEGPLKLPPRSAVSIGERYRSAQALRAEGKKVAL